MLSLSAVSQYYWKMEVSDKKQSHVLVGTNFWKRYTLLNKFGVRKVDWRKFVNIFFSSSDPNVQYPPKCTISLCTYNLRWKGNALTSVLFRVSSLQLGEVLLATSTLTAFFRRNKAANEEDGRTWDNGASALRAVARTRQEQVLYFMEKVQVWNDSVHILRCKRDAPASDPRTPCMATHVNAK